VQDVFDPAVYLLTPGSTTAVVESEPGFNRTIEPGAGLQFSFLGTKGNGERNQCLACGSRP
jgi:hypothetical protein